MLSASGANKVRYSVHDIKAGIGAFSDNCTFKLSYDIDTDEIPGFFLILKIISSPPAVNVPFFIFHV